jgi:hypothetical protein
VLLNYQVKEDKMGWTFGTLEEKRTERVLIGICERKKPRRKTWLKWENNRQSR